MTSAFKRQLIVALAVLAIGSISFILFAANQADDSTKNRNRLYQNLIERSGILNRDLPKLLDSQTRFERAEVMNYGMRFVYTLVAVNRYQHDVEQLREQLQPSMLKAYCSADSLRFYRERAEFLVIRYLDQNDALLFELRFEAQNCG